jgi:hypothetical protein
MRLDEAERKYGSIGIGTVIHCTKHPKVRGYVADIVDLGDETSCECPLSNFEVDKLVIGKGLKKR